MGHMGLSLPLHADRYVRRICRKGRTNACGVIRQYQAIVIAPFTDYLLVLSIAFAFIGVFAGLFGSVISIRKYLKV